MDIIFLHFRGIYVNPSYWTGSLVFDIIEYRLIDPINNDFEIYDGKLIRSGMNGEIGWWVVFYLVAINIQTFSTLHELAVQKHGLSSF